MGLRVTDSTSAASQLILGILSQHAEFWNYSTYELNSDPKACVTRTIMLCHLPALKFILQLFAALHNSTLEI